MNTMNLITIPGEYSATLRAMREQGRVIRAPHHTSGEQSFLGKVQRNDHSLEYWPGECARADGGVLFLTNVHEFPMRIIEGIGHIWRNRRIALNVPRLESPIMDTLWIPAKFDLAIHYPLCECASSKCRCTTEALAHHTGRVATMRALLLGQLKAAHCPSREGIQRCHPSGKILPNGVEECTFCGGAIRYEEVGK